MARPGPRLPPGLIGAGGNGIYNQVPPVISRVPLVFPERNREKVVRFHHLQLLNT